MRNPRIYSNQPLSNAHEIVLADSAANHVGRVLRMKAGEPLQLFNGEGGCWQGQITAVERKQVRVQLQDFNSKEVESPLTVHIGQVLSRGERMDYMVQKATEMGVTEITPLFSERCEVKLNGERAEKRLQHWQQVAISACEQCGRNRIPKINAPIAIDTWLSQRSEALKLVLHHRTTCRLAEHQPPADIAVLIGPEGGLSTTEIAKAEEASFFATALGPRVLRTETAPIAILSLLHYLWGDL